MSMDPSSAEGYEKGRRTKARLVEVAAGVFATEGYGGASIGKVAASADLTKGAVYAHFGSKRELWIAALSWAFEPIKDPPTLTGKDPTERLRDFLLWLGQSFADSSVTRSFFLQVIRESGDSPDAQEVVRVELAETYQCLRAAISDVRGDLDADTFAFISFSALLLDPDLHGFHRLMTDGGAPPHSLDGTVSELVVAISS